MAKRQALVTTSPTQSVLLAVVGIQIFKEFAQSLTVRLSARMFVLHDGNGLLAPCVDALTDHPHTEASPTIDGLDAVVRGHCLPLRVEFGGHDQTGRPDRFGRFCHACAAGMGAEFAVAKAGLVDPQRSQWRWAGSVGRCAFGHRLFGAGSPRNFGHFCCFRRPDRRWGLGRCLVHR